MSRRNKNVVDMDKYESDCKSYLMELKRKVIRKVDQFTNFMVDLKKLHDMFVVLVNHLFDVKKLKLCQHYAENWFLILLVAHDSSQLIQSGRYCYPYLSSHRTSADEIHPDRKGDFTWDVGCGDGDLNCVSIQGYGFMKKEKFRHFDKEMVSLVFSCLMF